VLVFVAGLITALATGPGAIPLVLVDDAGDRHGNEESDREVGPDLT